MRIELRRNVRSESNHRRIDSVWVYWTWMKKAKALSNDVNKVTGKSANMYSILL